MLHLFDTYIFSVIYYGCEILGHHKAADIESVHLDFCKFVLKVKNSVPNNMVYRELGRLPMYLQRKLRIIKYWTKLLNTDNCVLNNIYSEMVDMTNRSVRMDMNWAARVKHDLYSIGLGYVLENQCVGDARSFLTVFKQRLIDIFLQDCYLFFQQSPKAILYQHVVNNSLFDI